MTTAAEPRASLLPLADACVRDALRLAPFDLQRQLLEPLLREAWADAARDGAFAPLRGRWLRIDILDGPGWNLTLGDDLPVLVPGQLRHDARIAASLADFLLLATQQADPDTLFFQRRLLIEGDTALGLQMKHLVFGSTLQGRPAALLRAVTALRARLDRLPAPPLPRLPSLPSLPWHLPGLSGAPRRLDAARRAALQPGNMPAAPNQ